MAKKTKNCVIRGRGKNGLYYCNGSEKGILFKVKEFVLTPTRVSITWHEEQWGYGECTLQAASTDGIHYSGTYRYRKTNQKVPGGNIKKFTRSKGDSGIIIMKGIYEENVTGVKNPIEFHLDPEENEE